MGTGLTECIISGLLSVKGKRVLHVDRNNYYGSDTASLSLANLYSKFRNSAEPPAALGHSRDWNVDLVPKFIMACGDLVKILLHAKVSFLLSFFFVFNFFSLFLLFFVSFSCTHSILDRLQDILNLRVLMVAMFLKMVNHKRFLQQDKKH